MKLFNINNNGDLNEVSRLNFVDDDVYIVDDDKTIYIWVGLQVPQKLKDITANTARGFDKERGGAAKILIMKQNREYGSFLAIMDQLRGGLHPSNEIERRPELELEPPDVVKWLNQLKKYRKPAPELKYAVFKEGYPIIEEGFQDEIIFEDQIKVAAYYLSKENYDYNDLCWFLAEKVVRQNLKMPSIEDIKLKAEEVFNSTCTYDELCWLISELDVLARFNYFEDEQQTIFS